jgi:sodium pump decarboxylase gamma subunit
VFWETLANSGLGLLIVFIGLGMLIALVYVMGAFCKKLIHEENAPQKAPAASAAPSASAVPSATDIPNRDELVAVLSAAVAEELGTDVTAIRVVSLKQVN